MPETLINVNYIEKEDNTETHLFLASHEGVTDKQCIRRLDSVENVLWLGSTLFALSSEISTKH